MKIIVLNLKRNLHGWFNIILFIIPIIAMVGYIMVFNISSRNDSNAEKPFADCRVGIIDTDKTKFTEDLKQYLDTKYSITEVNESEASQYLVKNKINYIINLDKGMTENLINGKQIKVRTVSMSGGAMFTFFERDLNNYIRRGISAGILSEDEHNFYQYLNNFANNNYKLSVETPEAESAGTDTSTSVSTFWGFVIFFFIYYNCYFGNKLLEDKLSGKAVRIINTKYNYGKYISQLLLSQIILGLGQIGIMSVAMLLSDQKNILKIPYIMTVLFFANCLGLVLGVFISVISKGKNMYLALLNIIINVLAMLGGLYWSVKLMPEFMVSIAKLTPTYWVKNLMDNALEGVNIFTVNSIMIVIIYLLAIFVVSISTNKLISKKLT